MNVLEAFTRARKLLDDASKTDWPDADLFDWYNDSVVILRKARPDTQIAADGTYITYVAAASTSTAMLFAEPEAWVIALADYMASRAFGEDAGDKRDAARSAFHWQNFSNYVAML